VEVEVLVALGAGTVICSPLISWASDERPLSAARVSGETPFAAATEERLSPGWIVCDVPVVDEVVVVEPAVEVPLVARVPAASDSLGIWIVSPVYTWVSAERPL
jgi:hypothetical protein